MNQLTRAVLASIVKDLFLTPKGVLILLISITGVGLVGMCWWNTSSAPAVPSSTLVALAQDMESGLVKKDKHGDEWSLELSAIQSATKLTQGKTAPGLPLLVCADVRKTRQLGGHSIGVRLLGQAGEAYSPCVRKNGELVKAPRYTIVNRRNQVMGSGAFKYG
jgi:hypothetical protein